jgi:DeoR family transcriptional regulator, fructose operon transcriptional repressor
MSKNLIPAQRRERIQEYLAIHRIVPSAELSLLLEVSEATIRRDLEWMENEGILTRTHGGAILNERMQFEPEYKQRAQRFPEEKRLIGVNAASLIEDGDIVFINSGTTATQIIRNIRDGTDVTVVTNNVSAAMDARQADFELILLGGIFQSNSNSVTGNLSIKNLSQIYANKTFIGVDGITIKHGFTVPTSAEADIIHLMLERTQGPINVVADHSKWGVVSNFEATRIDQVHRLITDDGLSDLAREALTARLVEVVIAGQVYSKA